MTEAGTATSSMVIVTEVIMTAGVTAERGQAIMRDQVPGAATMMSEIAGTRIADETLPTRDEMRRDETG